MFAKLRNKVSTPPPPVATTGSPTSSSSKSPPPPTKNHLVPLVYPQFIFHFPPSSESHIPSEPELTQEQKINIYMY